MKLIRLLFFCSIASLGSAVEPATNLIPNPALRAEAGQRPEGWTLWSPRPEIAPAGSVVTRDNVPTLTLHARRFSEFGRWVTLVPGIEGGKYYRFEAWHQNEGVESDTVSAMALLVWCRNADGTDVIQTDYVGSGEKHGAWLRNLRTVGAPEGARAVRVELGLRWTETGAIYWKDVSLTAAPAPAARTVRVVTTRIMPQSARTIENNKKLMAEMFDRVADAKPDIVLFSENLIDRSTRLPLTTKAETIPGPLTEMLGERARKYRCYVITTLHERDAGLYYNTAVLIDREGKLVGKYRKVHLALAEGDDGLTPGSEYPVFDTDFGRIGILTCWDNWFAEPARILRLKGAEMLFLPLAGDGSDMHWDAISRARAMDNGLFFISSGTVTDSSRVITPDGDVLAEARGSFSFAVQDLDLNQEWRLRYLSVAKGVGEAKSLYFSERRPDTYGDLVDRNRVPPLPAPQAP